MKHLSTRQKMQPLKMLKSLCLPTTFVPVFRMALWVSGLGNIALGFITGIWWPFVTSLALSLHVRLPIPLGMVPPIFDATGNAFVTSLATPIGLLTLISAHLYKNPLWILPSLLLFSKSLCYHRDMAIIREKFKVLDLRSPLSHVDQPLYPRLPLLMRVHPYFLRLYSDVDLGGGVRIRRIKPATTTASGQLMSSIDVWYKSKNTIGVTARSPLTAGIRDEKETERKPLFFFIHGGGWKGGGARRHTQPAVLQRLALNGWAVVACNYRKKLWPQHVDDCYSALEYCIKEADALNIDTSRIVLSGASAGGQITALLYTRWKNKIAMLEKNKSDISAMVMYYPAIDPADDAGFTTSFPFDLSYFKAKYGQSLMGWFFERAVLGDDHSKWHSASPLRMLAEDKSLLQSWPQTMILHGLLDGIVPVEHSFHFLSTLAAGEIVTTLEKEKAADSEYLVKKSSVRDSIGEEKVKGQITTGGDAEEKSIRGQLGTTVDAVSILTNIDSRTGLPWAMRKRDAIVTLPGAKHSFEAVGGTIVDLTCEGVINWLGRV